ncbi:MAG: Sec-independent protein translocase protein TatB [Methylophilus sp.]|nr:Sec-independent protein translocase protein TatB [Methylophilus sp.]
MFDISFSELVVVAIVALLVIGPEKLPKVARTLGAYAGRMQRFVAQVKDEVNREVRFEELQKLQQEVKTASLQVESSIMAGVSGMQHVTDTLKVEAESATKPKAKRTRASAGVAKIDESPSTQTDATSFTDKDSAKPKRTATAKKTNAISGAVIKPARASKKIAD